MLILEGFVEADAVLKEIEELAEARFLPIIGPIKGPYLVSTLKRFKVKMVLEVGTLIGYSAILIAMNLPEDGKVFSIEINAQSATQAKENIQRANLADKVEVYIGDALQVIPKIKQELDMVFLDATKSEYLEYLKLCERRLKKGGVVFADNAKYFAKEMQNYLDYVRSSGKYKSEYIDVGFDGMEVSIKLF